MQNAHAIDLFAAGIPGIRHTPVPLQTEFPLHYLLNGQRDDKPIDVFHTHNVLEIGLCLDGGGIFHVCGKVLPFQAGDVTVITPLEWHRSQSAPCTVSTWAWFFFDPARLLVPSITRQLPYVPEDYAGRGFNNVLSGGSHQELVALLQELVREGHARLAGYEHNMRALLSIFLNRLSRLTRREAQATSEVSSPERIIQALDAMARRYQEPLSIAELARFCHMSLRNFQLHFHKVTGQTPQSYLIECRVQAAIAMLRTSDRSVTELAYESGFGSLSSFNRAFRAHTGRTPSDFRH
ncbi:MAG: helix-turn-helix domain-containing protein [Candidatus Methylacidiphilales bacterium]|nr:AraC family transcriptional regulator [Candidatus Methylacidiphilales bacterium]